MSNKRSDKDKYAEKKPKSEVHPDDMDEAGHSDGDEGGSGILGFARKFIDRKEIGGDPRELLDGFIATSDKAKNELMRIMAKEVRGYLNELQVKEALQELIQSHSLEVNASLRLKPHEDKESNIPDSTTTEQEE
jgi:hypothetical protein